MNEAMDDEPFVYFEGGDGTSMDDAVVIRGTENQPDAVSAEYAYIERVYGPGCMRDRQSIGQQDGHWYDILEIILPNGSRTTVHFDITEQFLGDLRSRIKRSFVGNESVLGRLDAPLARAMSDLDRPTGESSDIPLPIMAAAITATAVVAAVAIQNVFGKKKRHRASA